MRNRPRNRQRNQQQNILVRYPAFQAVWWHGIMLVMLLVFLPLHNAGASTGKVGDRDMTLNCEFTRYGNSGAATKLTKGWIPPRQTHHITGDEVVFDSYYKKLKGKVTKRDDERIEWTYQERAKDIKGRRFGATRYYSYFFTTKKIASKMGFKLYRDFEYVWGTCTTKPKKTTASKSTSQTSSKSKSVKKTDKKPTNKWTYLRGNGDISIYHHAKLDIFLVTSINPEFDALYDRLIVSPKTLIGVAMHWQDDDKSIGKNNYVYRHPMFVGTTMFGQKQAIIMRGAILDELKNDKQAFLEFAVTDMETDITYAEQTTTEFRE